jgi:urease accessory protein
MSDRTATLDPRAPQGPASDPDHGRALLQIWLSPAFPVGGFAYSHGLEKAVELGWIADRATLEAWLADLVDAGSLHNDLVLLAATWRATRAANVAELDDVASLAMALQPSSERLEASQQGRSFMQQMEAAWPVATAASIALPRELPMAYAIAVGHAAALHGIALDATLSAFAIAFTGTLTSAAIRLGVLGQTDGQRVLAKLLPRLQDAATGAAQSTLADLGGAAWRSDIASMLHETQTTRLFRS